MAEHRTGARRSSTTRSATATTGRTWIGACARRSRSSRRPSGADLGAVLKTVGHGARLERRRRRRARSTGRCSCRWAGLWPAGPSSTWPASPPRWRRGARGRDQARGKAEPGDKTMLDALGPGARGAAQRRRRRRRRRALAGGARPPREGMEATIPLVARKGRASYLGERSAGHQDPGATSRTCCSSPSQRPSGARRLTRDLERGSETVAKYAAALDQGTTSTRAMIFNHGGRGRQSSPRRSTSRSIPKPGWVEHDAEGDLGAHARR